MEHLDYFFFIVMKVVNLVTLQKNKVMNGNLIERITINPEVCHGKPTIRGTRHMVEGIIEYLAGGDTIDNILNEFPDLEREDIFACLAFAAKSLQFNSI